MGGLRPVVVALGATVAVLLAACSPPEPLPPPVPVPQGEDVVPAQVVIGVDDLGAGFNPHLLAHRSPLAGWLAPLVLPSVFRTGPGGALELDETIATSAEVVSTDPFTVSYELNLEASWSSNTPIAAEDFVYLAERMRVEHGVAGAAGYRLIDEVRSRAGGKAVDVVFSEPYPAWRELFANLLPAHILKDAPGSWTGATAGGLPASGGPFRVATVDRNRGEVVLARNDLYWDTPAELDQIVLRRLDRAGLRAGLATGDVDLALPSAEPVVRQVLAGVVPEPRVREAPQPAVTQLALRTTDGPLRRVQARRGLASVVDRAGLRSGAAAEALPTDAFGSAPSQPGYAPTGPGRGPDPASAAEFFTAAGWVRDSGGRWSVDGDPVRLVVAAATEREADLDVAELLAEQLEAAGIDADVVASPAAELFGQPEVTVSSADPASTTTPPTTASSPGSTDPVPAQGAAVRADIVVAPRAVGDDVGSSLASAFGCPPVPVEVPTAPCFPALDLVLDRLVSGVDDPELVAVAEQALWNRLPALPLHQPVTLVASTSEADAATGIEPGPLVAGPLAGAARWREPAP